MNCHCECCQHPWQHPICGCCEGTEPATPVNIVNRPGLPALNYRIGSHSRFMDSMLARLTSHDLPPLKNLTAREPDDSGIAMLDACATLADVLSFYQERTANEGYLRTAIQRRSVLELGRLPGYRMRPGVAASVYLAYTMDEHLEDEAIIPAGSAVQSIPGPEEQAQTFETSEGITARYRWNNLQPRLTQPQTTHSIFNVNEAIGESGHSRVYLKGTNTQLKINDALLIQQGEATPEYHRVYRVIADPDADRTLVLLSPPPPSINAAHVQPDELVYALTQRQSLQPRHSSRLGRAIHSEFSSGSQSGYTALKSLAPRLKRTLANAAANSVVSNTTDIKVYALRQKASLFGHNTPKRTLIQENGEVALVGGHGNWPVFITGSGNGIEFSVPGNVFFETENAIHLDAAYDGILPGSWLVIRTRAGTLTDNAVLVTQVQEVDSGQTRSQYGMSGPTTRIDLGETRWLSFHDDAGELKTPNLPRDFDALRMTSIFAQSELLELAEEPITDSICSDGADLEIELDGFYDGLESGRWVIVSGERDIAGTSGVKAAELVMLASVEHRHRDDLPGDSQHTFIRFAEPLEYCFKRDRVRIYGNVVKATHGETREEILGNGSAREAFQTFELKQAPLTYTAANNPAGVDSSLMVRVQDVQWHEADCIAELSANDRRFSTSTDDKDKTSIIFGNGIKGARLPTGTANVTARYRNGLGAQGNVQAEQISLLKSQSLGVKEVINPLRASGGAEREHEDQARHNIPLAVKALDRLVSVQDYEDFSRVYAGIGKARATEISDGHRQVVHVTIAGADDIPIDETSDLFRNLRRALHDFGDPYQPLQLAVRERVLLTLQAQVKIHPDYQWEIVSQALRETLLETFGFAKRELGQDVYLSEILSAIHQVSGVVYVDADAFGGIPEKREVQIADAVTGEVAFERRFLTPDDINQAALGLMNIDRGSSEITFESSAMLIHNPKPEQRLVVNLAGRGPGEILIHPAQIAFFAPDVPATLILNQIE